VTATAGAGKRRRRCLQFLAGIFVIFGFSSVPQSTLSDLNPGLASGWGHFLEFGLWGWLWYRWRQTTGRTGPTSLPGGLGIAALVAVTDEAYQSLIPGRSSELVDVILDLAGFTAGILVGVALARTPFSGKGSNRLGEGES
jgi:VanZ family protein